MKTNESEFLILNKVYFEDCLKLIERMEVGGVIPDLVVTDPPYEFEGMTGGEREIHQKIIDIGTNHFDFESYIPRILDLQKDRINAYFFTNKVLIPKYLGEAVKRGLTFDILAIRKLNPIPCKSSSYMPELEYVIFLRSPGVYFNGKMEHTMYRKVFDKVIGSDKYDHPNEKPLQLIRNYIQISSQEGDLVADFFMGSGTTAQASLMLGRNFIGTEINPAFSGVINKKIERATTQRTLL